MDIVKDLFITKIVVSVFYCNNICIYHQFYLYTLCLKTSNPFSKRVAYLNVTINEVIASFEVYG